MNLGDKIREMQQYLEPEDIAAAVEVPIEVVLGVLSGKLTDDKLDNYDIDKPAEVRIVEKKKIIRSRVIGVLGTSSVESSLLTAYIANCVAERIDYDVAIIDFGEMPSQLFYFGVNKMEDAFNINFLIDDNDNFKGKGNKLQKVSNLSIFLGATSSIKHSELNEDRMIDIISDVSSNYGAVFVECPSGVKYWKNTLKHYDILLVSVEQNNLGMSRYTHIFNYIKDQGLEDRAYIVLSYDGRSNGMSFNDAIRAIRNVGDLPIITSLPQDEDLKQVPGINNLSKYAEKVNDIADEIFPDTKRIKRKGLMKLLTEGLGR